MANVQHTLPPDFAAKIDAWRQQHAALQAPHYRITLVPRTREGAKPYVLGKRDQGPEVLYTAAEVEGLIGKLRGYNARGHDVYITPLDPAHHYILIDDMSDQQVRSIQQEQLSPCLIQKSSTNNHQAVIKIPRTERPDEQSLANRLVGQLNRQHGDPALSGVVHPFRMAGFSNQKLGRRKAFTKIGLADHRLCLVVGELLQQLRYDADQARASKLRPDTRKQIDLPGIPASPTDNVVVVDYKKQSRMIVGLARKNGWSIDLSVVDYRVCLQLLRNGHAPEQVVSALLSASPELDGRHSNPDEYAKRTVLKAQDELGL